MNLNYEFLPVADLRFDPLNPRIPDSVDASDDQEVLGWMLEDAGLLELMGSIAENGYFPAEPLLVTADESGEKYIVLEGNRRLGALLLLVEPDRAPKRRNAVAAVAEGIDPVNFAQVPCAVFDHRDDVLDYLGYRHITGVKQWEPAAKARYLDALYRTHLATEGSNVYRHIARIIGSRADYVRRLLGALRVHESIFRPTADSAPPVAESEASFSLLTLAINYAEIARYLELGDLDQESFRTLDRSRVKNLAHWIYHVDPESGRTQLGESRNMKLLAAAVADEDGIAALERGEPVEEAVRATIDATQLFTRTLREARSRLVASQTLVHRAAVDESAINVLDEVEDLADQLRTLVRRKLRRGQQSDV